MRSVIASGTITPVIIVADDEAISRFEFSEVPKHIPKEFGTLEWLEDHLGSVTVEKMSVEVYTVPDFCKHLNDEDGILFGKVVECFYREEE